MTRGLDERAAPVSRRPRARSLAPVRREPLPPEGTASVRDPNRSPLVASPPPKVRARHSLDVPTRLPEPVDALGRDPPWYEDPRVVRVPDPNVLPRSPDPLSDASVPEGEAPLLEEWLRLPMTREPPDRVPEERWLDPSEFEPRLWYELPLAVDRLPDR